MQSLKGEGVGSSNNYYGVNHRSSSSQSRLLCSNILALTRNTLGNFSELISTTINNIIYNRYPLNSIEREKEINLLKSIMNDRRDDIKTNLKNDRLIYRANRLINGIERSSTGKTTRYFLSTLMKSGTKHIETCFESKYKLERFTPSFDFSSSFQSPDIIKPIFYLESDFMLGESFVSYHLYPGQTLLADASRFNIPIFVMLRNPAQAIVSHYHYCLKHRFNSKTTLTPGEYFGPQKIMNKEDIREHLIKYTLPRSIEFVSAWMNVSHIQKKYENINVTIFHHEELVNQQNNFYQRMNRFLEITEDAEELNIDSMNQLKNHNMRKGSTNEWKDFFSRDEKDSYKTRIYPLINKYSFLNDMWDIEQ